MKDGAAYRYLEGSLEGASDGVEDDVLVRWRIGRRFGLGRWFVEGSFDTMDDAMDDGAVDGMM
jgi:hypothetical protein